MRCVEKPAGIQGRHGPGVPGLDSGVVYRLDAEVVSGVPLGLAQPGLRGGLPGLASGGLGGVQFLGYHDLWSSLEW